MYIKRIELQGFKSFLNKTKIDLERGLTSIVGPNGCGKSNIVDAIRWVLGEQKNSRLRSSKKEDIIFNGTSKIKATGFCEVKLIVDNDFKILPIEYSEVEICRRLFRTGDSEYYINKNLCRLKDIQDLFIDTGMSSDAYSVIELRMIDEILINNHSNLKMMLDSASGILNYNKQRKKTNNKLEKVSDNLLRVNDIISEIEKNLKTLNLQMKRYSRHESLLVKLKEKELLLASIEIQGLINEKKSINKELEIRNQDQDLLKKQLLLDEKKILEFQKKQDLKRLEINDVKNKIITINESINNFNNSIIKYSENQKYNISQIDYYSDQISEIISNAKHSDSKIKKLKSDLKIINSQINKNSDSFTSFEKKHAKDIAQREVYLNRKNKESQKLDDFFKIKLDLDSRINLLESKIKNYKNHLVDLKKFKYDKNCKYCIKNGHNQINEKKDINEKLKRNQIELKKIRNKKNKIIKNYETQNELLKKIKNDLAENNKKNEKINQLFHELKIEKIKFTKEKEGLDYRLNYFLESRKNLSKKKNHLEKNIEELKLKNINIDNKIIKQTKGRDEVKDRLINVNKNAKELEKKYESSSIKLKELQERLLANQKIKEEKIINKQKYEINISNLDNEIKIINNTIKEKYNIKIQDNVEVQDNSSYSNLKEQIDKHKVSIVNIGPINMEVKFEHEKETERFEFLKTQRFDLEDSRKALKQTIAKLDQEAKKRYLDTFNDVNKHLKTTFSMFFHGGESSLNLIDRNNPLESNIEIIAKPPGKKVKKLNSLSAGEKALTAISILFAIYLKKPSPFCVLDEVDAPLDDNNIYKFTNVLKEFSKKTQFIIITHNKLTMNQCNLLHGVTQEQEGVSKIVSVKLNN